FGGVEYYPMADSNLHFFLTYVGRSYRYKDVAKELGFENYNTSRLSLGFIYQLPLF
ncbi:MAG: porin, partial [Bacteroides sp.]